MDDYHCTKTGNCLGGRGLYLTTDRVQYLTTGRDGKVTMSRRDGTVISSWRVFFNVTGRQVMRVKEFVGGKRWDGKIGFFLQGSAVLFRHYRRLELKGLNPGKRSQTFRF